MDSTPPTRRSKERPVTYHMGSVSGTVRELENWLRDVTSNQRFHTPNQVTQRIAPHASEPPGWVYLREPIRVGKAGDAIMLSWRAEYSTADALGEEEGTPLGVVLQIDITPIPATRVKAVAYFPALEQSYRYRAVIFQYFFDELTPQFQDLPGFEHNPLHNKMITTDDGRVYSRRVYSRRRLDPVKQEPQASINTERQAFLDKVGPILRRIIATGHKPHQLDVVKDADYAGSVKTLQREMNAAGFEGRGGWEEVLKAVGWQRKK